jgi:hypothetical protein
MFRKIIACCLLTCLLGISGSARAEPEPPAAYYPRIPPPRLLGYNQGNFGSCMAAAQNYALEHAFAQRGYHVRLSLFYSFNYLFGVVHAGAENERWRESLHIDRVDEAAMERWGPILPEYMWPEDGTGLYDKLSSKGAWVTWDAGARFKLPAVSVAVAHDGQFPAATQFGFQRKYRTFDRGHRHSVSEPIMELKAAVAAQTPVVLTLHRAILEGPFADRYSGLVTYDSLQEVLAQQVEGDPEADGSVSHQVAVVGYDDEFYGEDGAFFVRNSWNSPLHIQAALDAERLVSAADLERFQRRMSPGFPAPGFVAIPYRYVLDLFQAAVDGDSLDAAFILFDIDYREFYRAYQESDANYEVFAAPFSCAGATTSTGVEENSLAKRAIADWARADALIRSRNAADRNEGRRILREVTTQNAVGHRTAADFRIAYLSKTAERDNLKRFYRGEFDGFYCFPHDNEASEIGSVWPSWDVLRRNRGLLAIIKERFSPLIATIVGWDKFLGAAYAAGLANGE